MKDTWFDWFVEVVEDFHLRSSVQVYRSDLREYRFFLLRVQRMNKNNRI